MRWSATALLVIALVGCSGGGEEPIPAPSTPASVPAPEPRTLEPAKAKALQDVLARVVAFPDSPSGSRGVTASVVTAHWSWSGAAGVDVRGTPLRADMSMPVASITNTFVAAEVMLLAGTGRINIDLPLARYLNRRLTVSGPTVREDLSMTAGGPFSYSDPSYVLLGRLIEKVTGKPLRTVLQQDLAVPAGLRHIAFQDGVDGAEADAPTVARWGYQLYGGRVLPLDLVDQMVAGDRRYGLGTMRFTQLFGLGEAYGHAGDLPGHTSLLVVIPARNVSICVMLADGDRYIDRPMSDLTRALEALLD